MNDDAYKGLNRHLRKAHQYIFSNHKCTSLADSGFKQNFPLD